MLRCDVIIILFFSSLASVCFIFLHIAFIVPGTEWDGKERKGKERKGRGDMTGPGGQMGFFKEAIPSKEEEKEIRGK